ncbi:thiamine pyrophosphate-binding protein, partial [Staphylococcus hominis]|uniref:thiamine pyrophosphate-binding protein n=1 Tax=Staphylococcus hominis TaxID=1290 RepID=UPI0021B188A5
SLKFYHVGHEEVGSLSGAGYRKLTGKMGVGLSIGGGGVVELLNGMYEGKMEGVGEVIIRGERNSRLLGRKLLAETTTCKMVDEVGVFDDEVEKG